MSISGSPVSTAGLIEIADQIDRFAASARVHTLGVRHEQHGIAFRSKFHALVDRRQKPAAPAGFTAVGSVLPEKEDDESGQIWLSLPDPYVNHEPMLGRPNTWLPVFMKIWPGAWLNCVVCTRVRSQCRQQSLRARAAVRKARRPTVRNA